MEQPLIEGRVGFEVPISSGRTSSGSHCCCFSRCGGSAGRQGRHLGIYFGGSGALLKSFFEALMMVSRRGCGRLKRTFFGRMNIDVNGFVRKGDEEEERGEASATDQGMIDFIDRMINNRSGGGGVRLQR